MQSPSSQNFIPQITIECVIFGYENKRLKVLISKLDFKGDFWVLPGGFISQEDDIDVAAYKILQLRTGIENIFLEQFRIFGKAERNNTSFINKLVELNLEIHQSNTKKQEDYRWLTKRFIGLGYYALVDINKVIPRKSDIDQSMTWYDISNIPQMILDHNECVNEALKVLRRDIDEKLTAFNLLPETFTMREVQELYETIFGKTFERANFQKKILELNILERLEKKFTGAQNKAPYLYRFMK